MIKEEKKQNITAEEAAATNLSEDELQTISGGVLSPEDILHVERIATGKAPTMASRGVQAAFGTALGFAANDIGTIAGSKVHKKK